MTPAQSIPGLPGMPAMPPDSAAPQTLALQDAGFADRLTLALQGQQDAAPPPVSADASEENAPAPAELGLQNMPPALPWWPGMAANFSTTSPLHGIQGMQALEGHQGIEGQPIAASTLGAGALPALSGIQGQPQAGLALASAPGALQAQPAHPLPPTAAPGLAGHAASAAHAALVQAGVPPGQAPVDALAQPALLGAAAGMATPQPAQEPTGEPTSTIKGLQNNTVTSTPIPGQNPEAVTASAATALGGATARASATAAALPAPALPQSQSQSQSPAQATGLLAVATDAALDTLRTAADQSHTMAAASGGTNPQTLSNTASSAASSFASSPAAQPTPNTTPLTTLSTPAGVGPGTASTPGMALTVAAGLAASEQAGTPPKAGAALSGALQATPVQEGSPSAPRLGMDSAPLDNTLPAPELAAAQPLQPAAVAAQALAQSELAGQGSAPGAEPPAWSSSPQALSTGAAALAAAPAASQAPVADVSLPIKPHLVSLEGGAVQVEVLRMAREGGGQVTLELTPPDQGRYRLDLRIDELGRASLVVEGASESTRSRLEMGEASLREQFAQMGLQLNLQMRGQQGQDSAPSGSADSRPGPQGPEAVKASTQDSVAARRTQSLDLDRGLVRLYA